jgi:hypothetical protein
MIYMDNAAESCRFLQEHFSSANRGYKPLLQMVRHE